LIDLDKLNEQNPRLDVFGFKPNYAFQPLSSLSVIFRFARFAPSRTQASPVRIIDAWFTESPSRFLTDNFGIYHASMGGGLYLEFDSSAQTLEEVVDSLTRVVEARRGAASRDQCRDR
jgi:hypothetical protein